MLVTLKEASTDFLLCRLRDDKGYRRHFKKPEWKVWQEWVYLKGLRIKWSTEHRTAFPDLAQSVSSLDSEQQGKENSSVSTPKSPVLLDIPGT